MKREQLEFGSGSFVGDVLRRPSFFKLSSRNRARVLGWANGCPIVEKLTDPENKAPGRGPEAMINRYGSVNYWFGLIAKQTRELNPDLYRILKKPLHRRHQDKPGIYEKKSVPPSYVDKMAPMNTVAGYSMPRLLIEQMGIGNPDLTFDERADRMMRGVDALEKAIVDSKKPGEMLARLAGNLAEVGDLGDMQILRQTFSLGWFVEQNDPLSLYEVRMNLAKVAPDLWKTYTGLSAEEKAQNHLA
ncbi:MAG TPA: hypothetical protein VFB03_01630 [Candidatus Saccharimonadales bacterium]|nr:hypothetical protein [Candidatus Saccharimonadales bacterium]